MKNPIQRSLWIGLVLLCSLCSLSAQQILSYEDLLPHTIYFSLGHDLELNQEVVEKLSKDLQEARYVGLAELHRSRNLSLFTVALLKLLHKEGFNQFALELGPYSAQMLQHISSQPSEIRERIRQINQTYGSKLFDIAPFVFADRMEDALFLEKAAELNVNLWGLDQEFFDSFELHLDSVFALSPKDNEQVMNLYQECKSNIKKWRKKEIRKRDFAYTCTLLEDQFLQDFFNQFEGNALAEEYIQAIKVSLEIYCKNEQGKGSNQERANYMKRNFEEYYRRAEMMGSQPKVFVKMGSVHLSKATSIFGVEDLGKYLTERAQSEESAYLNIRHLRRYRNGRDLIGKKGWREVGLLMQLGKKNMWTLTDLRPIRKRLEAGEYTTDKHISYELRNYDFLLIPPNDRKSRPNF